MRRCLLLSMLLTATASCLFAADETGVDYLRDIKPLLIEKCARCHGTRAPQATLRLDSRAGALTGGDSGPALVPGKSSESRVIHAVTGSDGASKMPPEGAPLSDAQIDLLKKWIDAGAIAPADEITPPLEVTHSDHWSFQPVQRPTVPDVTGVVHPIDAFIRQRLAAEQLTPSPPAPLHTQLRRVHLDLLGLPPSPALVDEFLGDTSPDAYERLVDRLLASPHFGERWGRDWLDAARYADSNGFTRDMPRVIWKYRDWVIDALNANQPFDDFTIDQLAGDLRPDPTLEQRIATGFHRNTLINEEGGTDPEQFRVEAVVDRVNTTGTVFLGLTVGCAQCHDHKYDPISQREYYQLFAVYNSTTFIPGDQAAPRLDVPTRDQLARGELARKTEIRAAITTKEKELEAKTEEIQAAQDAWEKTLTDDDKKALPFNVKNAVDLPPRDRSEVHKRDLSAHFKATATAREKFPQLDEIAKLRAEEPQFVNTMVVTEEAKPRETFVMVRGDFLRPGAAVKPNVPAVLPPLQSASDHPTRMDFARWLVSRNNPLTARVFVNRVWQRYFGRGLVETENDFGKQGDPPTHPELLDWLADEFMRTGWDTKQLHRLIVTSETYRQASVHRDDLDEVDPLNKLLGRQNRLRIDAESIRDAALEVSGLLAEQIGGPPVTPPQPDGVFDFTQDKKPWKDAEGASRYRRAIYTQLLRSSLYPGLTVFDFPDPNVSCTRRNRSNTPLQALTLANDKTFIEFARGLGERLLTSAGSDAERVTVAMQTCVSRPPNSVERERLLTFLQQQRTAYTSDEPAAQELLGRKDLSGPPLAEAAAWTALARGVLNLDEFITRE